MLGVEGRGEAVAAVELSGLGGRSSVFKLSSSSSELGSPVCFFINAWISFPVYMQVCVSVCVTEWDVCYLPGIKITK